MPCVNCETRDKERGHNGVVGRTLYQEDGETYYTCLNCLIDELKEQLDDYECRKHEMTT